MLCLVDNALLSFVKFCSVEEMNDGKKAIKGCTRRMMAPCLGRIYRYRIERKVGPAKLGANSVEIILSKL